jgi:hypothetical protein
MRCFCATAIPVIIALSLAGTGCKPKATQSAGTETEQVSLFKEGKGVWFSEETTKLFGLETGEVQERAMQCQLRKTGQVYRAAREGVPARAVLLLSASEAEELRAGQSVGLTGSGNGGAQEVTGRLVRLGTEARRVFDQIEALIEFGDPWGRFPAGSFVRGTFTNEAPIRAFAVPESALLTTADGRYVYTVNGTHLTRTPVKTGTTCAGFVAVEDGLYAGDLVAVKGVENLWLVELSALKGGTPCCPASKKKGDK